MNKQLFIIFTVLGITSFIAIAYVPIYQEQQMYLNLDTESRQLFIQSGMSCSTILASVQLHESPEEIPLKFIDHNGDGKVDEKVKAETLEECWDACHVLMEGYTSEPDHYFFHVPFGDDGYMFFAGLDEKVEECKNG